ncbi:MAG TPA: hypothetical protein PK585_06140 [Amphiplicatus sp.]|nr:hypothetical protein [Amphiplicatus sp.]
MSGVDARRQNAFLSAQWQTLIQRLTPFVPFPWAAAPLVQPSF